MSARRSSSGFTLIELMVALAILGVITSQLMLVFTTQRRVATVNNRVLDVQAGARLVLDLVSYDARMAGFLVPRAAGISSSDGGAAGPDRLCISDSSYFDTPLDGTASTTLDNRAEHFANAKLTDVQPTNIQVQGLDIDEGGAGVDFVVGDGVIISDGNRSHCAEIASIAGLQINLVASHAMAAGLFVTMANVRAVPAIVYEVNPATLVLTRNGIALSTSVEDLQVEFWVDNQIQDGVESAVEFPIHDLNVDPGGGWLIDTELIRRVRVTVVTRTDSGDQQVEEQFNRFRRPAVANRDVGALDQFRRRRFAASISPRNLF